MGKKSRNRKERKSQNQEPGSRATASSAKSRWVAVSLLVFGAGLFLYALSSDVPSAPGSSTPAGSDLAADATPDPTRHGRFRYYESADDARPFPETLPPSQFRDPLVAASYQIAQEIPEVLAQQPCLCGCDNPSDDHKSLLSCFTDQHAATCMVCMKEAVFASQKTEEGKSGEWIRDAILRHEFSDVTLGS